MNGSDDEVFQNQMPSQKALTTTISTERLQRVDSEFATTEILNEHHHQSKFSLKLHKCDSEKDEVRAKMAEFLTECELNLYQ